MEICHSKENFHEQHEVTIRHKAQTIRALFDQSMELFSPLRVDVFILMLLEQIKVKPITTSKTNIVRYFYI